MKSKDNIKKSTKQKKKCLVRKRAQERLSNMSNAIIQKESSATVKFKESLSQANDATPFPTSDNGNSHPDKSFLIVASKQSESPLKSKLKSTSFHIVYDLL